MVMMNIKLVQRGVNSKLNGIGPVPLTLLLFSPFMGYHFFQEQEENESANLSP